jgi:ABC-type transport system involved in multi-copper enzyme maturation permease subunit
MTTYRWDDELGVWMPRQLRREGLRLRWERLRIVALREMRGFMRGTRAPQALFLGTALAIAVNLALLFLSPVIRHGGTLEETVQAGKATFHGVVVLEAVLVVLLVPLLTAGMVAWEYKRHTIEGLLLTRLTGMDIAAGKLIAATGFIAVALCCTIPIMATDALVGGVSLPEVVLSQLALLAIALCVGAFGLFMSARCRDARVAAVLTLLLVLACSAALPLLAPIARAMTGQPFFGRLRWITVARVLFIVIVVIVILPIPEDFWLFTLLSVNPALGLAGLLLDRLSDSSFSWFADNWWYSLLIGIAAMLLSARFLLKEAAALIRDREVPD